MHHGAVWKRNLFRAGYRGRPWSLDSARGFWTTVGKEVNRGLRHSPARFRQDLGNLATSAHTKVEASEFGDEYGEMPPSRFRYTRQAGLRSGQQPRRSPGRYLLFTAVSIGSRPPGSEEVLT